LALSRRPAGSMLARRFGLIPGSPLYRSLILHCADALPLQLEWRAVHPQAVPDYFLLGFSRMTPAVHLTERFRDLRLGYEVRATKAKAWERKLLSLAPAEPCLSVATSSFVGTRLVSVARLLHPASRFNLRAIDGAARRDLGETA
jgi:GntR family transcriptional regulator, histidine utilization repressor